MKIIKKMVFIFIILILVILIARWWKVNIYNPHHLENLSPEQIVNLYYRSCSKGDAETLEKIIFFQPDTTEEVKQERVGKLINAKNTEGGYLIGMLGIKFKPAYEKKIDESTAEVGIISKGGLLSGILSGSTKGIPHYQVILKKEHGIWKYHHYKGHVSLDKLEGMIRANPQDASLYYYYGMNFRSENPAKAYRYFRKYYELEPKGFWVTSNFLSELKELEPSAYIREMQQWLKKSSPADKSNIYLQMGQCFMQLEDYEKADQYFIKAEEVLREYPDILQERLKRAKKELQLRKEGKYIDLLDEIEKRQQD